MRERATLIATEIRIWAKPNSIEGATHLPNYRASEGTKEGAGMSADITRIRVLTVDDHPVVRQGIAGLLGVQPDMVLVGEASNLSLIHI